MHRPSTTGPPPAVVDLGNVWARASHPATRPTVQLPEREWLEPPTAQSLPAVCGASAVTVPADASGDRRTAKSRQNSHYLSVAWDVTYKPIRSHNEGINGRLKSGDLQIGNPQHRPAPGQVAQTLLTAILITIGNLDILETWLHQRTGTHLTDTDYQAVPAQITGLSVADPPETTGRPPPAPRLTGLHDSHTPQPPASAHRG